MWVEVIDLEVYYKLLKYKAKKTQAVINQKKAKKRIEEVELGLYDYRRKKQYNQLKGDYTDKFMGKIENFENAIGKKLSTLKSELNNVDKKIEQLNSCIRNLESRRMKRVWKEDKK